MTLHVKDLETRFTEPDGWRWHSFKRGGRTLRFGSVFPKNTIPKAVVIALPGLSEFAEKYFETARNCLEQGYAFWVMDWMGQGGSGRYFSENQKRHITSFNDDIEDFHAFITGYVKHACVHPDVGRIPMAMLAHSMGGHLGLRFLHRYPGFFECAAFSAPFLGIYSLSRLPSAWLLKIARLLSLSRGSTYVKGHGDWAPLSLPIHPLTNNPERGCIQDTWLSEHPNLQVGGVTYKWVYEALLSCRHLFKIVPEIKTPCIIASAGQDIIVSNSAIEKAVHHMPHVEYLKLPAAKHEILMENDESRQAFLDAFYKLIQTEIVDKPETIKRF